MGKHILFENFEPKLTDRNVATQIPANILYLFDLVISKGPGSAESLPSKFA